MCTLAFIDSQLFKLWTTVWPHRVSKFDKRGLYLYEGLFKILLITAMLVFTTLSRYFVYDYIKLIFYRDCCSCQQCDLWASCHKSYRFQRPKTFLQDFRQGGGQYHIKKNKKITLEWNLIKCICAIPRQVWYLVDRYGLLASCLSNNVWSSIHLCS